MDERTSTQHAPTWLRGELERVGISRATVAQAANFQPAHIDEVAAGRRIPTPVAVAIITNALDRLAAPRPRRPDERRRAWCAAVGYTLSPGGLIQVPFDHPVRRQRHFVDN
jgi:hypothetical protein